MGEIRRSFSEEFKREAVDLTYSSGKTITEVANDLGITRQMLSRWRMAQERMGDRAFPGQGRLTRGTPEEEEIRKLKRELAVVKEERDILKKAMAIFSRTPK